MPRQPQPSRENRFSQRLNQLFETRLAPTTPPRPWTLTEVAEQTGLTVGYLSKARLGFIEYPGRDKLKMLAEFFKVHVDYFTQEREEAVGQAQVSPDLLRSMSKPGMASLFARAEKLGPAELELIDDLLTYIESRVKENKEQAPAPPAPSEG